ncbi:hypothetical protein XELAEV_18020992mg, partial [Xenopus laevis]
LVFRTLVRKYSPMIIATDFVKYVKVRDSEFTTNQGDCPFIVQFAAKEAHVLADAASLVSPFASGIDLNCGCPQRWAMAEGYGACLIKNPELVSDMVRQVHNQVDNPGFPVSIKIRIHTVISRTVDLYRKAEAAVHYDAIKKIKESLSIPVVANGDIESLKEAENVQHITGVDGYEETPLACMQDWVDIALEHGIPFTCLHHHLMYMTEKITSKQEKRIFNVLSSTSAVLDYLRDHYGIQ